MRVTKVFKRGNLLRHTVEFSANESFEKGTIYGTEDELPWGEDPTETQDVGDREHAADSAQRCT